MLRTKNHESKKPVCSNIPAAGRFVETLEERQFMSATPVSTFPAQLQAVNMRSTLVVSVAKPKSTFAGAVSLQGVPVATGALAGGKLVSGNQSAKSLGQFGEKSIAASTANILKQIEALAQADSEKARQASTTFAATLPISANKEILARAIRNLQL